MSLSQERGLLETGAAWLLGFLWILPLLYAFWTAFHPPEYSTRFALAAPLTLDNFVTAWAAAPFARLARLAGAGVSVVGDTGLQVESRRMDRLRAG